MGLINKKGSRNVLDKMRILQLVFKIAGLF